MVFVMGDETGSATVILFMWLTHILRTCVQLHCKGFEMVCEVSKIMYNVFYKGNNAETIESKTRFVVGWQPSESAGMDLVMNISSQVFYYLSSSHVLKFHKNPSGGAS